MPFHDREEAGRLLAKELRERSLDPNLVIMALPRGGVPIGYEVAKELKAPFDVLVTQKIGAPGNPEYGIGALTEEGFYAIDPESAQAVGTTLEHLRQTLQQESSEVVRRIDKYRKGSPRIPVQGKTVILVDDGLATGVTARVAGHFLKKRGAARVILAVPVCSPRTVAYLKSEMDEVLCLEEPEPFYSVGQFYEDFSQLSDDEVVSLLKKGRKFSREFTSKRISSGEQARSQWSSKNVTVSGGQVRLSGNLTIPASARGIVIFAHGSGSSRLSPRNQQVAKTLNEAGIGTFLFDLLTPEESLDRSNVFDIPILADRLILATRWLQKLEAARDLAFGYFGASTGAAAALWAAAELITFQDKEVSAIVSRGGRPDLSIPKLQKVTAPTLLIVGGKDEPVISMNQEALKYLKNARLVIIPEATHLFDEPGTLENVAQLAVDWFKKYFVKKVHHEAA